MWQTRATALLLAAGCAAHPSRMLRIPNHKELKFMENKRGVYDKDIVSENGFQCTPNDGYIVWGAKKVKKVLCPNHRCDSGIHGLKFDDELEIEHTDTGNAIVMCTQYDAEEWKIAGVDKNGNAFDPIPDTAADYNAQSSDVLIIGGGVGGWSAAAAIASTGRQIKVAVMAPEALSTTARSTGVAFFPGELNTLENMKKAPGGGMDEALVSAYIKAAPASLKFWTDKLKLEQYKSSMQVGANTAAPDYYTADGKVASYQSFVPKSCAGTAAGTCGAQLLTDLQALAKQTTKITAVAANVEIAGDTLVVTDTKNKRHTAQTLIIASGGIGYHDDQTDILKNVAKDNCCILASPENTGFVLDAAKALGLKQVKDGVAWNLEFEKKNGETQWKARWFDRKCTADVKDYDVCSDYSTRALTLTHKTPYTAQGDAEADCTKKGPSAKYWANELTEYSIRNQWTTLTDKCADRKLQRGAIDVKGGFKINSNFQSTDNSRVFASGTAAAHITGDKYFAPGATIGLALHSGYMAGQTASALSYNATIIANPRYRKKTTVVVWFLAGTWTGIAGVTAHYNGYRRTHYATMFVAAILVTVGALTAVLQEWRSAESSAHAVLGYTALSFVWANVFMGSTIAYARLTNKESYQTLGKVHRTTGVVIITLMASLSLTGVHYVSKYYAQYDESGTWVSGSFFTAAAAVLSALVIKNTFFNSGESETLQAGGMSLL